MNVSSSSPEFTTPSVSNYPLKSAARRIHAERSTKSVDVAMRRNTGRVVGNVKLFGLRVHEPSDSDLGGIVGRKRYHAQIHWRAGLTGSVISA
jgi:hypothetical protein